jgi:hypothetical protein
MENLDHGARGCYREHPWTWPKTEQTAERSLKSHEGRYVTAPRFIIINSHLLPPEEEEEKAKRNLFSPAPGTEYNRLVDFTISSIVDRESERDESLERSIACFWLAIQDQKRKDRGTAAAAKAGRTVANKSKGSLRSFAWIAAVTCLVEVDKFQRSIPF